jgi:XTP/dITP diphosphohydrolase
MPELLLATFNPGKIREYLVLLRGIPFQITTLAEQGIREIVAESGTSYEQNARLKAVTYAKLSQITALADDSGLEVDALDGAPGIRSARYAGEAAADADKVDLVLTRLRGVPWEKRAACFKCVIVIATPEGQSNVCYGECRGVIALEARGENGFGYDPIFVVPKFGKTMAELPPEIKNKISHRALAALKAREVLRKLRV